MKEFSNTVAKRAYEFFQAADGSVAYEKEEEMKKIIALVLLLSWQLSLASCVGIGYSSRGGWFVWPGGLGLLVLIVVIILLFRRR